MSCEEHFIEHLRAHGFRLTPQRELILSILHQIEGFATAEEIYTRVHAQSSSVDLSTVYRTLDLLQSFGLVATMEVGDGQQRYVLLGIHGLHHHLHCTQCGSVIPVAHSALSPLLEQFKQSYGFAVTPASLTFSGLCADCLAAMPAADADEIAPKP